MTAVPAGWYPDPQQPDTQRYWDGQRWTEHTAPLAPQAPPATQPATVGMYAPPPAAPTKTAAAGTKMTTQKKWLIGGGIAAGIIVVGSIGNAIGAGNRAPEPEPTVAAIAEVTPEPTPTPEPEPEATTEESPEPEPANPVAFKAQAGSHLDDINKDLDDLVITVEENGFWRLLSNYGEISFNLGQLEALDVPDSVAGTWSEALVTLEASIDVLGDAVSTEDGGTILAAIDGLRAQVEATRAVVNTAS